MHLHRFDCAMNLIIRAIYVTVKTGLSYGVTLLHVVITEVKSLAVLEVAIKRCYSARRGGRKCFKRYLQIFRLLHI